MRSSLSESGLTEKQAALREITVAAWLTNNTHTKPHTHTTTHAHTQRAFSSTCTWVMFLNRIAVNNRCTVVVSRRWKIPDVVWLFFPYSAYAVWDMFFSLNAAVPCCISEQLFRERRKKALQEIWLGSPLRETPELWTEDEWMGEGHLYSYSGGLWLWASASTFMHLQQSFVQYVSYTCLSEVALCWRLIARK